MAKKSSHAGSWVGLDVGATAGAIAVLVFFLGAALAVVFLRFCVIADD
jgi:hypothetical protein